MTQHNVRQKVSMVRTMSVAARGIADASVATTESGTRDGKVKRVEAEGGEGEEKVVVMGVDESDARVSIGILIIKVSIIMYVRRSTVQANSSHWLISSLSCRRS